MTESLGAGSWGVQQLAGFLVAVAAGRDVEGMLAGAAHRIAEALDAEVCAIVTAGEVSASVGFPAAAVPTEAVLRVADGHAEELEVPGVGRVPAIRIDAQLETPRTVVIGRVGEEVDAGERHLVRAMAQVLELALQLSGTAQRERRLREAIEGQARELQRVNDQLVRAVQVKRDLVSMTSHELRTPLVAMLGFARLLKDGWEDFDDADRDDYLAILERHGQRMLRLVDDLLTVGRLADDRMDPRLRRLSLSHAIADILRGLRHEVRFVPATDADEVDVDPDHLAQIVANLLDNAHEYGAPPVEVHVAGTTTSVSMSVVDAGEGVPVAFVPMLFERFTQASTGFQREGTGVGLGLAIVAGLVERNRGTVVYDRNEGRTRFTVRFPRASGGDRRAAPPG